MDHVLVDGAELVEHALLFGRVTYEMMESYWPAVARGDEEAPPAIREWAVKLDAKPKYVVSSTRTDYPWTNSHHLSGDLRTAVQALKDATPDGVLLGSGTLANALDRLDLIDEYRPFVHPVLVGGGLPYFPELERQVREALSRQHRVAAVGIEVERQCPVRVRGPPADGDW